ncbi:MAG: MliC family protein [Thermodesulfobacteriota bacterium]
MRINKFVVPGFLLLLLMFSVGWAHKRFKDDSVKTKYKCENGFEFVTETHKSQGNDQVILKSTDNLLVLDIIPSASGMKYTDGVNTFWSKGENAMFELADKSEYKECHTVK